MSSSPQPPGQETGGTPPVIEVRQWEQAAVARGLSDDWESRRGRRRWSNERYRMSQLLRNNLETGVDVVDVGCGPGFYVPVYLEKAGPAHTYLVDRSEKMLAHCRQTYPALQADHLVSGSIHEIPFPAGRFRAVVNCDVLMHIAGYRRALEELFRICDPDGGRVFLRVNLTDGSTYGDLPDPARPDPEKIYWVAYGRQEFRTALEALGPAEVTVIDRICRKPLKRGGDPFVADAAIVVLTRGRARAPLKLETRLGHLLRKVLSPRALFAAPPPEGSR